MSRILVPRGEPPLPVFQLTDASPFWGRLTTEEQDIARRTAEERPVMFLGVALQVNAECLCDFRRARDEAERNALHQRLNGVLARTLGGATEDEFRAHYTVPARVRLLLLGAERADAERLSEAAVETILNFARTGAQPSPRLSRFDVPRLIDLNTVRRRWDENSRWLAATHTLQSELGGYVHHELRAFPQDPPPDSLFAARGPRYEPDRSKPAAPAEPPSPRTAATVDEATRHVRALLGYARLVVTQATREPSDTDGLTVNDFGGYAAGAWEGLGEELGRSSCLAPLRDHLHLLREENYAAGGVIQPSVHETIQELARRVWMAMRSGVCATADQLESDRWVNGPWQGHEVVAALAWLREHAGELVTALNSASFQTLEADLKRESAQMKSRLDPLPPTGPQSAQQGKPASNNRNGRGPKPKKEVPPKVKEHIIRCFDKGTKNAEIVFGLVGAKDHGLTAEDVKRTINSYRRSQQPSRKTGILARTKKK